MAWTNIPVAAGNFGNSKGSGWFSNQYVFGWFGGGLWGGSLTGASSWTNVAPIRPREPLRDPDGNILYGPDGLPLYGPD